MNILLKINKGMRIRYGDCLTPEKSPIAQWGDEQTATQRVSGLIPRRYAHQCLGFLDIDRKDIIISDMLIRKNVYNSRPWALTRKQGMQP